MCWFPIGRRTVNWLPLNKLTEKFWYTNSEDTTMRIVVSAPTEHPLIWACTKIENIQPIGIQKLTIYQTVWSDNRDYIEKDENGNIIGMWASYFDSEIAPTDPSTPTTPPSSITAKISASTSTIKVGGSYKNLTVNLFNDSNEDVTTEYSDATITWTCSIDNESTVLLEPGQKARPHSGEMSGRDKCSREASV